ncbi:MAG: Hsp70 family protein, partial [Chloroflexota bacterium]
IIGKTKDPCRQALKDAGLDAGGVDEVVLVGGSTRIPKVQKIVTDIFGKEPRKGVNPDEVVAIGAAIQAGVLGGEVKDILLLDVTPLTLSIETLGGVATPLIERNATIPTRKSQIFSTASDSQTQVEIHVLQGERAMAADNKSLGKFILDGIPPAPRGVPQIDVTFDIDASGILHVSAADKATGREQSMEIIPSSGLSEDEIEEMVEQAERHRDKDRRKKEQVEARNQADTAIYSAEKLLREQGDELPAESRSEVEAKVEAVKEVLDGDDLSALRSRSQELRQAVQHLGAEMYEKAAAAEAAPESGDGADAPPAGEEGDVEEGDGEEGDGEDGEEDEDVIEGDFSEV